VRVSLVAVRTGCPSGVFKRMCLLMGWFCVLLEV
jgi:hypothetical protein